MATYSETPDYEVPLSVPGMQQAQQCGELIRQAMEVGGWVGAQGEGVGGGVAAAGRGGGGRGGGGGGGGGGGAPPPPGGGGGGGGGSQPQWCGELI